MVSKYKDRGMVHTRRLTNRRNAATWWWSTSANINTNISLVHIKVSLQNKQTLPVMQSLLHVAWIICVSWLNNVSKRKALTFPCSLETD